MTDQEQFSIRHAMKFVKKMRIQDNSIVVLQEGSSLATKEHIEQLVNAAHGIGLNNVLFVVSKDLDDIRVINQTDMAKYGWYRIEHLKSLIHK